MYIIKYLLHKFYIYRPTPNKAYFKRNEILERLSNNEIITMKFTKEFMLKIFELKKNEPNKFDEFINSLSDKQHIEFSEALKLFVEEIPIEFHDTPLKENLAELDKNIALLEDGMISNEINEMMGDIELEALANERRIAYMELKNELKKKLLENPSSPEANRLINLMIKNEKDNDIYNKADWADVLPLLGLNELSVISKPVVEETPPIEELQENEKSPYSRPPLTRNQIFLKLDKIKFKEEELAHFMSTKGITREEYCIAVPMLFSMYESTKQYKTNKLFREAIIQAKKEQYEIVASYTEYFKKQKEAEDEANKAKEDWFKAFQNLTDKLKENLLVDPNSEDIKNAIKGIIANLKNYNIYNEAYWEDVLHLL